MLEGKWVWIWNYRDTCNGDPVRIARRVKDAGCAGVLVKSGDGGHDFGQGKPIVDIIMDLRQQGIRAEPWEFLYGRDTPGYVYGTWTLTYQDEAQHLIQTASTCGAALVVMDVEGEYENAAQPTVNARLTLSAVKSKLPQLDLYYAPLAQPNYHRSLPYHAFNEYCEGVIPQAYYDSMEVSPERAIALTYDSFASEGITGKPLMPACGCSAGVDADGLLRWANAAIGRGAACLSFWSFEEIENERPGLWDAIARIQFPGEEDEMAQEALDDIEALKRGNAMQQKVIEDLVEQNKQVKAGIAMLDAAITAVRDDVEVLKRARLA